MLACRSGNCRSLPRAPCGALQHLSPPPPATHPRRTAASAVFASLAALQGAASKGSAADAKRSFVAAAGALQTWAVDANVAGDLKGL